MKVLVIGNGGREQAICNALNSSKQIAKVYALPGSLAWENVKSFPNIEILNFIKIKDKIIQHGINLVIVGPELPIIHGIYDYLKEHKIIVICPTKFCSQIESSKIFSKDIMKVFNIPTAKFDFAISYVEYEKKIQEFKFPVVLKSDNLAFGKGVLITNNITKANKFAADIFEKNIYGINNKLLIEEFMEGEEFSLFCLVNKGNVLVLPPICDHKSLLNNGKGEMTGGMGVYNNPKFLTNNDIDKCVKSCIIPLVDGIKDSNPYYGILFAGIMKTKQNQFKVIEYNIRFGDPETEILLPMIKNDFLELIVDFYLENKIPELEIDYTNRIGIVVAAKGYPSQYNKNISVNFLKKSNSTILMGVTKKSNKWLSSGGRIFMYKKSGSDFKKLYKEIYLELNKLIPKKIQSLLHYRKDIGKSNL